MLQILETIKARILKMYNLKIWIVCIQYQEGKSFKTWQTDIKRRVKRTTSLRKYIKQD